MVAASVVGGVVDSFVVALATLDRLLALGGEVDGSGSLDAPLAVGGVLDASVVAAFVMLELCSVVDESVGSLVVVLAVGSALDVVGVSAVDVLGVSAVDALGVSVLGISSTVAGISILVAGIAIDGFGTAGRADMFEAGKPTQKIG